MRFVIILVVAVAVGFIGWRVMNPGAAPAGAFPEAGVAETVEPDPLATPQDEGDMAQEDEDLDKETPQ